MIKVNYFWTPFHMFYFSCALCFVISGAILLATFWGYKTRIDLEKTSIYECGFTPYQSARVPLEIKFYLISLLFIIFDVEVLILFPFAVNYLYLNENQIIIILFFIGFIFLSICYEMKLKAINF